MHRVSRPDDYVPASQELYLRPPIIVIGRTRRELDNVPYSKVEIPGSLFTFDGRGSQITDAVRAKREIFTS